MVKKVAPIGTVQLVYEDGTSVYEEIPLSRGGLREAIRAENYKRQQLPELVVLPESLRDEVWPLNLGEQLKYKREYEEDKVLRLRALLVGSKPTREERIDWAMGYGHGVRTPDTSALLKVLQS